MKGNMRLDCLWDCPGCGHAEQTETDIDYCCWEETDGGMTVCVKCQLCGTFWEFEFSPVGGWEVRKA